MVKTSQRKCGFCTETGHNRRSCPNKETKGKTVFNYTPLLLYIFDFLVADNSYKELYELSQVSSQFQKSVHFITRNVFEIQTEICDNTIFKYFQCFTNLRKLNLTRIFDIHMEYDGKLNRGLKHATSLTQLTHLDLSGVESLPINFLSYFNKHSKLQHLKISYCPKINNKSLSYLQHFPNLTYLNLRGAYNITNLRFLKHCPNLVTLKICCTNIHDNDLKYLKFCTKLNHLTMEVLPHITTTGFKLISQIRSLHKLHIIYADLIDNSIAEYLKTMPLLNHVICRGCDVTNLSSLTNVSTVEI